MHAVAAADASLGYDLGLSIGDQDAVEVDIDARTSKVATLGYPATRRGWLPLPRVTIETTWPLGLIRAWSYAAPELACLVYPAPAAKADAPKTASRSNSRSRSRSRSRSASKSKD